MRNVLRLKLTLIPFLITTKPRPEPAKEEIVSNFLPYLQGEKQMKGADAHFDSSQIYFKNFPIYQNEKCSINWTSNFKQVCGKYNFCSF